MRHFVLVVEVISPNQTLPNKIGQDLLTETVQAPLNFFILLLPYLPAHSHPVIAMVMWSCFPSVSGRNSNSSMAPTRFFILYPTHNKTETQISEIAQQGQTLLTVEVDRKWLGSWIGSFPLQTPQQDHALLGMEPTWSFWAYVICVHPSRRLFCCRPDISCNSHCSPK